MPSACLAEIHLFDPVRGERVPVRLSSSNHRNATGVAGAIWEPALIGAPTLTMRFWNGDFSQPVSTGSATLTVAMGTLRDGGWNVDRCVWSAAPVAIWHGDPNNPTSWRKVFAGTVRAFSRKIDTVSITAEVNTEAFDRDILTATYAGTGNAEGGADLKGRVKPLVIGWATNVEPILINAVDNVYQFSGYGPIEAVTALFERGSSFGTSLGDHANYAALVGATIAPGRWATCLAEGLVRLGAPQAGVITGDVKGHVSGSGTPRTTGTVIATLATLAGVESALIDEASLTALNAAAPYPINFSLAEQRTFIDMARRLALACNYQSGISLTGSFFVCPVAISESHDLTLDAQGRALPQVVSSDEGDVSPPYWKHILGAARSWRVHSTDEVAFTAALEDKGRYSGSETYREGNMVDLADGSRWLYINPVASSGNAPPTWPTTSNAYWDNLSPPLTASGLAYVDGTPIENLKPAQAGATVGAPTGTPVGSITAGDVSGTIKSGGGVANNQVPTPAIVANGVNVPWFTSSSTVINFAAATKTLILSLTVTKELADSDLQVEAQCEFFGNDAVDIDLYYEAYSGASMVESRAFRIKIDANGTTNLPFAFRKRFTTLGAGTYDIRFYGTRFSANTCNTEDEYDLEVIEVKR